MSDSILIAEDEEVLRRNMASYLRREGYDVTAVPDGKQALEFALNNDVAVVISDIRMPELDGIALLKRLAVERPGTAVLVITAYASVDTAVDALRHGASDYLLKPIAFEELRQKVRITVSRMALEGEVRRLRRDLQVRLGFEGIVGDSAPIRDVFELVDKVAPTPSTVLVAGASGTGKELIARAIHTRSTRSEREFLAVNVGAMPSELVESQLFGHERGAFTGAATARKGIFRAARGGTVFLDEVGELPGPAQAKLLRALDQREITPVGADRAQSVDFRLIAATNRNMEQEVEAGRFRADLYYRLNVFRIDLPTLSERREDVPALVHYFLQRHAQTIGRGRPGITNRAMQLLTAHEWPGNVRELSNILERAVILAADHPVGAEHLPAELQEAPAESLRLKDVVERAEREHILRVLRFVGHNRDQAADELGIDRATLYRRLSKYNVEE